MSLKYCFTFGAALGLLISGVLLAEDADTAAARETLAPEERKELRVTVIGSKERENLVSGSAYYLSPEELEDALTGGVDDIHRVLRRVPGVNIQEEDGFGLRPNIGLRGVPNERSSNITLMEDGVLIAPAPYSAPAAYFFPPVGRMNSIEVLKGASQIKYGPYTTGGSINFLSTPIPSERKFHARFQGGAHNTAIGHAFIGESFTYGGVLLETYQAESDGFKDLDGGGDTGFDIEDYVVKFRLNTPSESEVYSSVDFKMNFYEQESNETYLGLTQDDFDANPFRRYRGSQLDEIDVDHQLFQVRHYIEFNSTFDLTTQWYRTETDRNWFKLERVNGVSNAEILSNPASFSQELDWIRGANSPEDAFSLRNNNRAYRAWGVESKLGAEFETGTLEHLVEVGVRYHDDYEDRFQDEDGYQMVNGNLFLTSDNPAGSNSNRISSAEAWAFFVQDEITWDRLTVTPGVRYEYIDYTREDFGTADPNRTGSALSTSESSVNEVIPGVNFYYQALEWFGASFGLHKGFSPPGPVGNSEVEEEESINLEWGAHVDYADIRSELVFFYNDYDNLLGADTVSSGGEGTGDLFNGGEASVFGLEASISYDFAEVIQLGDFRIPFRTAYTLTQAEFDSSFDSEFFGIVRDGDSVPYIPENQLFAEVGLATEKWGVFFEGHYVDAMPTIAGQAGVRSTEKTDSYFVFDLRGEYRVFQELALFASVENIFDEEYVVARRPAGARPGLPQSVFAGVKLNFS